MRNPGLFEVDYKNATVIVMGPGSDVWARLCSRYKFSMILILRDRGREEEKEDETSSLCLVSS